MPRRFEEKRAIRLDFPLAQVTDRDPLLAWLGPHHQPRVWELLNINRKTGGLAIHR